MSPSGQESLVVCGSTGNLIGLAWMSRTSEGKLCFSTTESMCLPSIVNLIAPYGHSTSHIPQKLHFAKSMSTMAFLAFSP